MKSLCCLLIKSSIFAASSSVDVLFHIMWQKHWHKQPFPGKWVVYGMVIPFYPHIFSASRRSWGGLESPGAGCLAKFTLRHCAQGVVLPHRRSGNRLIRFRAYIMVLQEFDISQLCCIDILIMTLSCMISFIGKHRLWYIQSYKNLFTLSQSMLSFIVYTWLLM